MIGTEASAATGPGVHFKNHRRNLFLNGGMWKGDEVRQGFHLADKIWLNIEIWPFTVHNRTQAGSPARQFSASRPLISATLPPSASLPSSHIPNSSTTWTISMRQQMALKLTTLQEFLSRPLIWKYPGPTVLSLLVIRCPWLLSVRQVMSLQLTENLNICYWGSQPRILRAWPFSPSCPNSVENLVCFSQASINFHWHSST